MYDVEYAQGNMWKSRARKNQTLDQKKVVIGAFRDNGEYEIAQTTDIVAKAFPGHKDLVFESALDFLSHFKIVMPEDVPNHPALPPLGLHLPNHEEKEVDPWFDTESVT
ncbi:MAG: hypothetical protein ACI84K_000643 [Pseudohongiellaceae bacterium]